MIKLFWANLKHLPTTGAAILTISAWALNTYCGFIPKNVADSLLVFINAAILTVFVGAPKE
jgi:hypothetical protein